MLKLVSEKKTNSADFNTKFAIPAFIDTRTNFRYTFTKQYNQEVIGGTLVKYNAQLSKRARRTKAMFTITGRILHDIVIQVTPETKHVSRVKRKFQKRAFTLKLLYFWCYICWLKSHKCFDLKLMLLETSTINTFNKMGILHPKVNTTGSARRHLGENRPVDCL